MDLGCPTGCGASPLRADDARSHHGSSATTRPPKVWKKTGEGRRHVSPGGRRPSSSNSGQIGASFNHDGRSPGQGVGRPEKSAPFDAGGLERGPTWGLQRWCARRWPRVRTPCPPRGRRAKSPAHGNHCLSGQRVTQALQGPDLKNPEPLFTWKRARGPSALAPRRARSGEGLDRRPAERGPIPWCVASLDGSTCDVREHRAVVAPDDPGGLAERHPALRVVRGHVRVIAQLANDLVERLHGDPPARAGTHRTERHRASQNRLGSDPRLGRRLKCGHVANRRRWPQRLSSCCPGGELCSRRCARSVSRAGYQRPNSSTDERRRVGRRLSSGRCSMRPGLSTTR